jgi:hypothetical protein
MLTHDSTPSVPRRQSQSHTALQLFTLVNGVQLVGLVVRTSDALQPENSQ